jgi:hypothetical protein
MPRIAKKRLGLIWLGCGLGSVCIVHQVETAPEVGP